MEYREIIAVCSEIHAKYVNRLCEQNVEFLNVNPGGAQSIHWMLKRRFKYDIHSQHTPNRTNGRLL